MGFCRFWKKPAGDSGKNLPGILEKTCRGFWKKPATF
jgi:hypothetical protein